MIQFPFLPLFQAPVYAGVFFLSETPKTIDIHGFAVKIEAHGRGAVLMSKPS